MTRPYPLPRWRTPMPAGAIGSWGPDVEAWARVRLGLRLDRWQRDALDRALATDAQGQLVHRVYLVSTARQNGKTALVRALVGWALTARTMPPWETLLGVAWDRGQARRPYDAVRSDLEPVARRLGPDTRGGLTLTRYFGMRSAIGGRRRSYEIGSKDAPRSIRGISLDLGLFDEVREQRGDELWAALEPATRARPEPLIFATSSAGDERSVLLRAMFDRGLRIIAGAEPSAGFGMTWYAPPDDADPADPLAWRSANPALASGRLDPARIAEARRGMTGSAFRTEALNLWADATDTWLEPGIWARQDADDLTPDARGGWRLAFGIDATPTWRRATIALAGIDPDGREFVGLVADLDAGRTAAATIPPADLLAELGRQAAIWHPAAVAYSGSATVAPHVERWAEDQPDAVSVALSAGLIRNASELFRAELIGGRLWHPADPLLASQAALARPSGPIEGGAWYFGIRQSLGDIDAIRAASWAVHAVLRPVAREVPPQLFV